MSEANPDLMRKAWMQKPGEGDSWREQAASAAEREWELGTGSCSWKAVALAEGGERVAGTEVRAEETGGSGGREREAEEDQLRVRLEGGSSAEGREQGEVEEATRRGGDGAAGAAAHGRRREASRWRVGVGFRRLNPIRERGAKT
nr:unnamed protein product [Digitaria exilis]